MTCLEILQAAVLELKAILQTPVFSSVYRTKAMYVENQEDFYNMVAGGFVADDTDPFVLLKKINEIEAAYGRDRSKEMRFGPRSLDIDIEIFGNQIINTPTLVVPHERIKEREFVLVPLLEIFDKFADKKEKQKYQNYLENIQLCAEESGIKKLGTLQAVLNGSGTVSESK